MSDDKFLGAYHAAMQSEFVVLPLAIANKVGLVETVLIKVIDNWCVSNQKHEKTNFYADGEWWTQLSAEKIHKDNPCLGSVPKIRRLIKELESDQLLISFQSHSINRTKFYRVNKPAVGSLFFPCDQNDQLAAPCDQNDQLEVIKTIAPCDQNDQLIYINKLKIDSSNGLEPREELKADQPKAKAKPVDPYARSGVAMTANQRAKALIEEICPWDKFFPARKAKKMESTYWQNSKAKIVEGTILMEYAKKLDFKPWHSDEEKAIAIAEVKELIQTHVDELQLNSTSGQNQPQQGGLNGELARLLQLHKKDPAQALKQAQGNPVVYNKFLKQTTNA